MEFDAALTQHMTFFGWLEPDCSNYRWQPRGLMDCQAAVASAEFSSRQCNFYKSETRISGLLQVRKANISATTHIELFVLANRHLEPKFALSVLNPVVPARVRKWRRRPGQNSSLLRSRTWFSTRSARAYFEKRPESLGNQPDTDTRPRSFGDLYL